MGVKKFEIVLDSPVVYSGQHIRGKLLVDLEQPIKMRGIRLNYSGKATVRWSEGSGKNRRTYTNHETYLDLQQLVCGSYDEESELAEGQYVYIFDCELPQNSPCSFESAYGRVKYSIKATMDLPWKIDPVVKQSLTVASVMDLNRLPVAAAPVSEQGSKTFWGNSKPLLISFELPIRGYVPGQLIPIKVFMHNESDVEVKKIIAELHQNVMFHATSKSRPWKTLISETEFPINEGIGSKEAFLRIKVPALPPSYLEFCKIIDVRYHLTITAGVSGLHTNLQTPTEILIGNVPLIAYQKPVAGQQVAPEPIDPENPSHSQSANYRPPPYNSPPPSATYGELPPPTYEQSTGLGKSEKEKPSDDSDSDSELEAGSVDDEGDWNDDTDSGTDDEESPMDEFGED